MPLPSALKEPHPNPHPLLHGAVKVVSSGDDDGGVGADASRHDGGGAGGGKGEGGASESEVDSDEARAKEGLAWAEAEAKKTLDYGATDLKGPMASFEKTIGDILSTLTELIRSMQVRCAVKTPLYK